MATMKACRFWGQKDLRVEDIPVPSCGKGQIKVKDTSLPACKAQSKSQAGQASLVWYLWKW